VDLEHLTYYTARPAPVVATGFPGAPRVPEVRARRWATTRQAALFHPNARLDEFRVCWASATELTGNSTPHKVWRLTEDGRATHVATVWPPDGHKLDGMTMQIVQDPVTGEYYLLFVGTTHQAISGERDNDYVIAEVRGLGVGAPAAGEGRVFDSRALGAGGGEPLPTAGEIADAVLARLERALGRPLVPALRKEAENGAAVALAEAGVLTAADLPAALLAALRDHAFFAQFQSMLGQETAKILIELWVADPAQAPAWVRTLPGFPWRERAAGEGAGAGPG
jgi:hypothetical protein